MIFKKSAAALLTLFTIHPVYAQLDTYQWDVSSGASELSPHYKIYVSENGGPEQELQVLLSTPRDHEKDWQGNELEGRSFSYVNVSYENDNGPLNFRVVRTNGESDAVHIAPKSYGITPVANEEHSEVAFSVDQNQQYFSVHFE